MFVLIVRAAAGAAAVTVQHMSRKTAVIYRGGATRSFVSVSDSDSMALFLGIALFCGRRWRVKDMCKVSSRCVSMCVCS